ncbi:hypothetical protein RFI_19622 [Reticulomyxa filosa]|uniref:protein-tyrosine-phosphatase n=1 Tax=Reticulomyxa filosa TaxID=46433 RepID=X6MV22_RETFI|nr:hypothetical protein RFI_19622 [Reticulomyxa filosa]|eukprot:ETO17694.1 hypothetical protein RFI_19622 [Reticulomyxa filosa]
MLENLKLYYVHCPKIVCRFNKVENCAKRNSTKSCCLNKNKPKSNRRSHNICVETEWGGEGGKRGRKTRERVLLEILGKLAQIITKNKGLICSVFFYFGFVFVAMSSPDQKMDNERDYNLSKAQGQSSMSCLVFNSHDLFNDLQANAIVFDVREWSSYELSHVLGSYHLNVTLEYVNGKASVSWVALKDLPCEESRKGQYNKEVLHRSQSLFWIIHDNHNNEKSRATINEFLTQCIKKSHADSCIKTLESFETFQTTYPFLTKSSKQSSLFSSMFNTVPHYPTVIIPNQLYLGEFESSCDSYVFRDLQLTHVVNVAFGQIANAFEFASPFRTSSVLSLPNTGKSLLSSPSPSSSSSSSSSLLLPSSSSSFTESQSSLHKVEYCSIEIEDSEDVNIKEHFEQIFAFIDKALHKAKRGRVLVHCVAGISRSSTAVIGYLMKTKGMLLYDAFEYVKQCRPTISPNFGFFHQLLQFEKELHDGSKSSRALLSKNQYYAALYFNGCLLCLFVCLCVVCFVLFGLVYKKKNSLFSTKKKKVIVLSLVLWFFSFFFFFFF